MYFTNQGLGWGLSMIILWMYVSLYRINGY